MGNCSKHPRTSDARTASATMSRELMFENARSICWKTTVTPHNPLKMHRHDRARCIVGLQV